MLSEQDKQDMLADGLSEERRKNFETSEKVGGRRLITVEEIKRIVDYVKTSGEFPVSHRRINTAGNKL